MNGSRSVLVVVWALLAVLVGCQLQPSQTQFTLVINNGRVIDPASGTDALLNVGVDGDRIAAISAERLTGDREIDAAGMVVAPGFIDLHSHAFTPLSQQYQVRDGVTTSLNLESGKYPIGDFAADIADSSLMNFGASAGYSGVRRQALRLLALQPGERAAPAALYPVIRRLLLEQLDAGAIGIGLPLDYISKSVDTAELRVLFEVAGLRTAPVFVHIRRGVDGDPTGLHEVLDLAEEFSAPLHICHITHSAMSNTDGFLKEISAARDRGVDVTTEILPYNAGSTSIGAAVFGRNWQEIFGISYEDVQWAATGEFLTRETWEDYRKNSRRGRIIHHYVKEEWNRRAISEPGVIVVSDMLAMRSREEKVAPHNGAFARVLGKYVREEGLLSLTDGVARMTWLPALRVQTIAPAFLRKGRIQVGADADITVFDPAVVIDRATYENPFQPSAGIEWVIVNGDVVVRSGELNEGMTPGRRVTANSETP